MHFHKRYGVPIVITENGISTHDWVASMETFRIRNVSTLRAVIFVNLRVQVKTGGYPRLFSLVPNGQLRMGRRLQTALWPYPYRLP